MIEDVAALQPGAVNDAFLRAVAAIRLWGECLAAKRMVDAPGVVDQNREFAEAEYAPFRQ